MKKILIALVALLTISLSAYSQRKQMKVLVAYFSASGVTEDVPTAVSAACHSEAASQPAAIYNLQGQRLDTLQRGVNIVGGTKTIVK